MLMLENLGVTAIEAWSVTRQTPPEVMLTIVILTVIGLLFLRILAVALSLAMVRPDLGKPRFLAIHTRDRAPIDEIRMNANTMNDLGLKWGSLVRIKATGNTGTGRAPLVAVRRRNGLDNSAIEIGPDLQILLFKDRPDGPPQRYFAFSPRVKPGGFREFWDNPNPQLRFQNRLSFYIAFGLTAFQLVWAWITKT